MSTQHTERAAAPDETAVLKTTIRELVERYPETMEILAPLGIDLCCGGSYPLSEALDLHHVDRAVVVPRVLEIIAKGTRR